MLTTEIWGFIYHEVGDPPLSMVSMEYSCWSPLSLWPVITERKNQPWDSIFYKSNK